MGIVIRKGFLFSNNISKLFKSYVIQIIIMRILLDFCFQKYVIFAFNSSNYAYAFESEKNIFLYVISWIILLSSILLTKNWFVSNSPSKLVLELIYIIQFVPYTTMVGYGCFSGGFIIFTLAYWVMIILFSHYMLSTNYLNIIEGKTLYYENKIIFEIVVTMLSGLTVLYFGYVSGFKIDLNIFNAYMLRDEARTFTRISGSTYLLGLSRILIPTGIVYSIRKKKIWMMILFLIFAMLSFSFDGSKTLYLISIVAIFIAIFYKQGFNKYIPFLVNIILFTGLINFLYSPTPVIYQLIIRRLFFVPNVINNAYFDYMKTHSANLFSNLLRFVGYNGSYNISYVIGLNYFHSVNMSANTGTIGDALWQFKYFGALFLPFLIILLLKVFERSTRILPNELVIIPCVIFAYYLNNSSFSAACFSHGLFFFCVIMHLYKVRLDATSID